MPRNMILTFGNASHIVPVATEEELLEFANKVRAAGGADIIESLLPAKKKNPLSCLIANALNFSCSVSTYFPDVTRREADNEPWQWTMVLPSNMSSEEIQVIADAVGLKRIESGKLLLPKHIGNAARAFDEGVAFQNFSEPEHIGKLAHAFDGKLHP